jgi:hypothetical protein
MERERIADLMASYSAGDAGAFFDKMTCDLFPWPRAFKEFAKLTAVPKKMQEAFRVAWIETKGPFLSAESPRIITAALRVMTPPYNGRRAVRLFRGSSWVAYEQRYYGHSWTASAAAAENFAQDDRQTLEGGSVVLETLAPPAAIISRVKYPRPLTTAEREAMLPGAIIVERHDEQEYFVDPSQLQDVTVRQHYPRRESRRTSSSLPGE